MPQTYTVRDAQTGRTVTFAWSGAEPPTDADLADVFAEAGDATPAASGEVNAASFGTRLTDAMYAASPAPLFEPDQLPTTFGAVGAAAGGPAGAAVGGAGGALVRDLIRANQSDPRTPRTALAAAGNVGGSAALQGALTGAGNVVSGQLAKRGHRLYQGLLKPSKGSRAEFPDAVETLLRERATISQAGADKIGRRLVQSSDEAKALIAGATDAPPVTGREIVSEYAPVVGELRKRAAIGQPSQLSEVGARGRRVMQQSKQGIPLARAQELKQTAQTASSGAYRQLERGGAKELSAESLLDKATAGGLRKAIETRVPAIKGVNQRTQSLMGAERALEDALAREGNTLPFGMRDVMGLLGGGALGAVGGPVGASSGAATGLALMRLLAQPRPGSATAIGMHELSKMPLDQAIRMLLAAYSQSETPDEP